MQTPLPVPWRIGVGENLSDLWPRKPLRQRPAGVEVVLSDLCAGYGRRLGARRQIGHLFVLALRGQVHKLGEGHRLDAQFVGVFLDKLLGVVRPVERLASRVDARTRVVASNDQVVGPEVAPDDRVPHGLSRPAHSHCQGQQREQHPVRLVVQVCECLVRPHSSVVIDVAQPRESYDGMEKQHTVDGCRCPLGQLLVHTVQRISGLERHDVLMPRLLQRASRLR